MKIRKKTFQFQIQRINFIFRARFGFRFKTCHKFSENFQP